MKKIILFSVALMLGVVACREQPEEITDPAYARLFAPVNLEAEVQNVVNATLTWDKVNNAQSYTLELYENATLTGTPRVDETQETTFTYTGLTEAVEYAVRVKAVGGNLPESKWALVTFTTTPPPPPETVVWNFSDEEFAGITESDFKETETVRGLDVAGGTGGVRRTTNAVEIDGYSFTHRLDLRGGGAWNVDLASANRLIHFKAEKPCVLTVYANSGTAGRTLRITDKNNAVLGEYLTTGSIGKVDVNVTEATDIYIYSAGSGIEVYLIKMVVGGSYEPDHTATLRALAVTGETLTPAFASDLTAYTVNVAKSVTEVTITAGKDHPNQTVEGDGKKTLSADSVVFPVNVTAEDGVAAKTYTITVKREKTADSDATLKTLTVSAGTLTPAFDPSVTEYVDTLPNSVTSLTITGEANHKFAKVGNGGTVTADELEVGNNGPYSLVVLAEDLSVKTYSVTVVREPEATEPPAGVDKVWNFSDDAFKNVLSTESNGIVSETIIDGLTIIASSTKTMSYNTNSKSMDSYSFTHRLQLNGTGSTTERALKFDVTGDCTITIYGMSGNSSNSRPLAISDGSTEKATQNLGGSALEKMTYTHTGGAGSLYIYSNDSGINLYLVKVNY